MYMVYTCKVKDCNTSALLTGYYDMAILLFTLKYIYFQNILELCCLTEIHVPIQNVFSFFMKLIIITCMRYVSVKIYIKEKSIVYQRSLTLKNLNMDYSSHDRQSHPPVILNYTTFFTIVILNCILYNETRPGRHCYWLCFCDCLEYDSRIEEHCSQLFMYSDC